MVEAVAAHAAGTWTTPQGRLLVDDIGTIDDPSTYLASPADGDAGYPVTPHTPTDETRQEWQRYARETAEFFAQVTEGR
jgi:hypothetical protein